MKTHQSERDNDHNNVPVDMFPCCSSKRSVSQLCRYSHITVRDMNEVEVAPDTYHWRNPSNGDQVGHFWRWPLGVLSGDMKPTQVIKPLRKFSASHTSLTSDSVEPDKIEHDFLDRLTTWPMTYYRASKLAQLLSTWWRFSLKESSKWNSAW